MAYCIEKYYSDISITNISGEFEENEQKLNNTVSCTSELAKKLAVKQLSSYSEKLEILPVQ